MTCWSAGVPEIKGIPWGIYCMWFPGYGFISKEFDFLIVSTKLQYISIVVFVSHLILKFGYDNISLSYEEFSVIAMLC